MNMSCWSCCIGKREGKIQNKQKIWNKQRGKGLEVGSWDKIQ